MFMSALALVAAQSAQPAPPQVEQNTIVVTAQRISDLRAALAACLARNCPPDEDVNATLALAEGEFLNGDYIQAEQSIRASISRNQRHAGRFPEPVADLWRSQARVQAHRGRDPQALRSTRNILSSLREGLPREDHRHFTARLEIIEVLIKSGDYRHARQELEGLADVARAAGREDVALATEMRVLRLDYAAGQGRRAPAVRRLRELAALTDPARLYESISARLFLSQIYRREGDTARADALLASIPPSDGDRRTLVRAPRVILPGYAEDDFGDLVPVSGTPSLARNYERAWIDVGYWIEPEGHVSGVEVLREGAGSGWAESLLNSIRGRVFSPSRDGSQSYRLERYTLTAPYVGVSGTRLAARGRPRIEFMDLTTTNETGRAPDQAIRPGG